MKNAPKPIAMIDRGACSIADNIKAFNESPGAQATIAVLRVIKSRACVRCKKPGHREGGSSAFRSSAVMLCAPRFGLPRYLEAAGDLCAGKIYLEHYPARYAT